MSDAKSTGEYEATFTSVRNGWRWDLNYRGRPVDYGTEWTLRAARREARYAAKVHKRTGRVIREVVEP